MRQKSNFYTGSFLLRIKDASPDNLFTSLGFKNLRAVATLALGAAAGLRRKEEKADN